VFRRQQSFVDSSSYQAWTVPSASQLYGRLAVSRVFACFVDVQFEHPHHLADEKLQGLSEFTGTFKENWCNSLGPRL
jgi:hypothetical protein